MKDWIRAQLRRRKARRHLKRPAVETPYGFRFLGPRVMQSGDFEAEEAQLLQALLRQAGLFVNVGANYGYYICMARQMGVPSVAVEPVPVNLETLQRNIAENGWTDGITVHPVACGEAEGEAEIFGEGTGASFVAGWARNPAALHHLVPVRRLDALVPPDSLSPTTVMLIDVEGFELEVLRGATGLLAAKARPVIMLESGLTDHRPGGVMNAGFLDVVELLEEHGYRLVQAVDPAAEVTVEQVRKDLADGTDRIGTHNFLALPPGYTLPDLA